MALASEATRQKALALGLVFSQNIGEETLQQRIANKISELGEDPTIIKANQTEEGYVYNTYIPNEKAKRANKKKEALKLLRVRVTCNNPNKTAYKGDIIVVANNDGVVYKKFVPFNVKYHIPQIIYNTMVEKQCLKAYTDTTSGVPKVIKRMIPEYSIEVLTPITTEELNAIKQRQLADVQDDNDSEIK